MRTNFALLIAPAIAAVFVCGCEKTDGDSAAVSMNASGGSTAAETVPHAAAKSLWPAPGADASDGDILHYE